MIRDSVGIISIILPCFNAEVHVARGVASVLEQTYRNLELIAVNDGSTDSTTSILSSIADPRLKVISQPNRGVSAARNRGLAEATGEFVAFLDADDTWRADCLERLHAALVRVPEAVVAYCGWQNLGLPGGRGEPYIPPDYEVDRKWEYLLQACPWPIHAALARKEAVDVSGGFDERFPTSEDHALWLRVACFSPIIRVPEVLSYYHFHSGTHATENKLRLARNQWFVQKEFLKEHPEIANKLGRKTIRRLTTGELLKSGFTCYWKRDIQAAHAIFRMVMKNLYGTPKEWKYMIFALLPLELYQRLICRFDNGRAYSR
jgi:glycosyltransferase involved in cell wall biosynthesis